MFGAHFKLDTVATLARLLPLSLSFWATEVPPHLGSAVPSDNERLADCILDFARRKAMQLPMLHDKELKKNRSEACSNQ
jgi:hypothetical protein